MDKLFHYFITLIFFSFIFFGFTSFVYASETTVYLGGMEKNIETGEIKVYVPVGNGTVVIDQKPKIGRDLINQISTTYMYNDHLGSTVLTTDEQGNKTESYLYYPYGEITNYQFLITPPAVAFGNSRWRAGNQNQNSNFKTDKLYTSQRLDSSSDLYFYNARYYNPNIGNFISADKAEGPNRYSYVGNNPIMRNDPSGKQGLNPQGLLDWCLNNQKTCAETANNIYQMLFPNNKPSTPSTIKPDVLPEPEPEYITEEYQEDIMASKRGKPRFNNLSQRFVYSLLWFDPDRDQYFDAEIEDVVIESKTMTRKVMKGQNSNMQFSPEDLIWSSTKTIPINGTPMVGRFINGQEILTGNDKAVMYGGNISGTSLYKTESGKAADFLMNNLEMNWNGEYILLNDLVTNLGFLGWAATQGFDIKQMSSGSGCGMLDTRCQARTAIKMQLEKDNIKGIRVKNQN